MHLKEVNIKNFRSISEYTLVIEKSLLTLVGINEAGKSNVIKALSLLDPKAELSKNDIRDPSHDEDNIADSYVRFVYVMNADEQLEIENNCKKKILAKTKSENIVLYGKTKINLSGFIRIKSKAFYEVNLLTSTRTSRHYAYSDSIYFYKVKILTSL